MSMELDKAIEALQNELNNISARAAEIKKTINQLSSLKGGQAIYTDVEASSFSGGTMNILPDQFFGKSLSGAVKDYLKTKGRAATAQEIFEVLSKGGFEWPEDWKEKLRLKNLAISLGKNRVDFVIVPAADGNAYGLWDFYPEKKREREKKKQSNETEETPLLGPQTEITTIRKAD